MDPAYQSWHQQADDLHFRVQDSFDEPDHQACQALKQQMRELINDCSQKRSPRDIEERIKGIMQLLEPARNGSQTFMSSQDATTYHDTFERLRREVREHPQYS
jgi:hypothetical protein